MPMLLLQIHEDDDGGDDDGDVVLQYVNVGRSEKRR